MTEDEAEAMINLMGYKLICDGILWRLINIKSNFTVLVTGTNMSRPKANLYEGLLNELHTTTTA